MNQFIGNLIRRSHQWPPLEEPTSMKMYYNEDRLTVTRFMLCDSGSTFLFIICCCSVLQNVLFWWPPLGIQMMHNFRDCASQDESVGYWRDVRYKNTEKSHKRSVFSFQLLVSIMFSIFKLFFSLCKVFQLQLTYICFTLDFVILQNKNPGLDTESRNYQPNGYLLWLQSVWKLMGRP